MLKMCITCKNTKPIETFSRNKATKDGLSVYCKTCNRQYKRQWVRENPEKYKKHWKKAQKTEKYKDYRYQYERSEKRKQAHLERVKKYMRTKEGKQYYRKTGNTYRTHKTKAGGSFTPAEWYNLCKFYNFYCLKCNIKHPFDDLSIDHIKPVSKGGQSFIWNLQPLCKNCNSSKSDKEIDYRKTLPDWINRDGPIWIQGELF